MRIQKMSCLAAVLLLLLSVTLLPCAADTPAKPEPPTSGISEKTPTPTEKNTPETAEPVAEPVTEPKTDVPDADATGTDATGTDVTGTDVTGTDATRTSDDLFVTTADTAAVTEQIPFTPKADAKYATLHLVKGVDGWEVNKESYYKNIGDVPETVEIDPTLGDKHAMLVLEKTDNTWNVENATYYGTKLQVIPVVIITFLITLALTVLVNLLLIKIYKR